MTFHSKLDLHESLLPPHATGQCRRLSKAAACCALLGTAALALVALLTAPEPALQPAASLAAAPAPLSSVPRSKQIFERFDVLFHHQGDAASLAWTDKPAWLKAMAPFFAPGFTYDFVHPYPPTRGIPGWFDGEHTAYNTAFGGYNSSVFLAAGTDDRMTCAAFHLAVWAGPFAGVPAPTPPRTVHIKDLDFYLFDEQEQIAYNWCMVDVVDVLKQGGYEVLPPSPLLDDGLYPPPRAVDGLPAPNSLYTGKVDAGSRAENEALLLRAIRSDFLDRDGQAAWWAVDASWYGPGGIGRARNRAEYSTSFLAPLRAAFAQPSLEVDMLLCEANYCGAHFRITAMHNGSWLGAGATGRDVSLRVGMHARMAVGAERRACDAGACIAEAWVQMDLPAAFADMGIDLLARARVA